MRDHAALVRYLDARLSMPFAWGRTQNDCVSFAMGGVKVQTGRDLPRELGVDWTSAMGAQRVLKRLGGIASAVDRRLERIAMAAAQRGDLGLVEGAHGLLLVIVEGQTLVGPGPVGAARFPRSALLTAWGLD